MPALRFADIAVNLSDGSFVGRQRGRQAHVSDLNAVLARAAAAGVTRLLATGTDLAESRATLRLARTRGGGFDLVDVRCTVGVHPTCCGQFEEEPTGARNEAKAGAGEAEGTGGSGAERGAGEAQGAGGSEAKGGAGEAEGTGGSGAIAAGKGAESSSAPTEASSAGCGCSQPRGGSVGEASAAPRGEALLAALRALAIEGASDGRVAALGEMGLDGEREHFCALDTQARWFERQLRDVCRGLGLPLFLHLRGDEAVAARFFDILDRNEDCWRAAGGVVHSFDGSAETLRGVLDRGLHVGLNGCSVREARSLEVVKRIPLDRLLLETDAPWCGVRRTHAGAALVETWPAAVDAKRLDRKLDELAKARAERREPGEGRDAGALAPCGLPLPLAAWPQIKGRNEPANVVQVAEIVAATRGESLRAVAEAAAANAVALFWKKIR